MARIIGDIDEERAVAQKNSKNIMASSIGHSVNLFHCFFDGGIGFYAATMVAIADWIWKLRNLLYESERKDE